MYRIEKFNTISQIDHPVASRTGVKITSHQSSRNKLEKEFHLIRTSDESVVNFFRRQSTPCHVKAPSQLLLLKKLVGAQKEARLFKTVVAVDQELLVVHLSYVKFQITI